MSTSCERILHRFSGTQGKWAQKTEWSKTKNMPESSRKRKFADSWEIWENLVLLWSCAGKSELGSWMSNLDQLGPTGPTNHISVEQCLKHVTMALRSHGSNPRPHSARCRASPLVMSFLLTHKSSMVHRIFPCVHQGCFFWVFNGKNV